MVYHKPFQLLLLAALISFPISSSIHTITPIQSIRDGETLISPGRKFALGFFSHGNSKNRYVGIWFNRIPDQTIVWTANRENPVPDSSGVLSIKGGNLVLFDGGLHSNNSSTLWSTNVSTTANYSNATLTDTGNLVLTDDHQRVVWESFDHPTNTFLPHMKYGLDRRTNLSRVLTSWRSEDDPGPGEFSLGLDPRGMPQFFLKKGLDTVWRSGPWNGLRFSGIPGPNHDSVFSHNFVNNDNELYFAYHAINHSVLARSLLDASGAFQWFMWSESRQRWSLLWVANQNLCDQYAHCGPYGSCDSSREAECGCLKGFEPKTIGEWSHGCMRRKPLDCGGKGDGFTKLGRVKVPDTSNCRVEPTLSLEACEEECLKNCSCTAYARVNVSGEGSGCLIWFGNLIDLRVYSDGGQDIYIRLAASELDTTSYRRSRGLQGNKKLLVTIAIVILLVLSFCVCGYFWRKKAKGHKMNERSSVVSNDNDIEENDKSSQLLSLDFGVIAAATNDFSESNMLGKGGFGFVYKGQLLNGQEIAVKRLSMNSGQGTEQFKNEVILIAKLQHKNLVRLLGYCMSRQEKILVYEYMQNKSLDSLIFDQTRSVMLDWRKRFNITVGIARGILYMHEDSRFRIIHRDLKVGNILLDDDMNPKISDFGMARIFGGNQTQANTNRVVGTYGYMSPEYAMDGIFSVKSDVFSFGVILLEIISGKRNNYNNDCCSVNLIGHVWELWKDNRVFELVDSSMSISAFESEVLRCIQVGLLCVQEKANDRPNMSSVVFMLGNETTMPSPKQPAFCVWKENCSDGTTCSINEVSMTNMEAR
ncbi:G-type lectin S-receptor-like serine/threonine-protein kinase isoform X1 [Cinnamomum micranthum f. kanehirae]|uniref:Receptor-like serine/threonine-protein kinase n=1 Tax=Cinnamomum micranthum f. kanehirae TaxID=337451 RepID=A0A3S3PD76_9MAGN|nr:G-type lectin S-receptor-like serine/threonine-protein kinase isoform X1 [Cinnamomum micranthum f. kanehirae]